MNKVYLGILGLIAVLLCSCNKQSSYEPKVITISASIDEDTKSTYTDAGVFSWVNGDEISYILRRDSDDIYNNNTLATNQSGTSVAFTGSTSASGYTAVNLAFYPKIRESGTYVNNDAKYVKNTLLLVNNSTTLKATLQQPIAAYPDRAKGIIPMIGKKTGEDANNEVEKYHFYPVTGVLKVSFTGLPATATQIRLDMPDNATYALNGGFNIDTSRETPEIKESDCVGTKWGQKYLNFDYASSDDAFYFPIPTGTIPAGKLTVSVSDGTNILYSVTCKQNITLNRGEITELPSISITPCPVTISASGTSSAIIANLTFETPTATAKVVLANSISTGQTLIDNGNSAVQTLTGTGSTSALDGTNVTNSGLCYIVVRTYNSSDKVRGTYSLPVYYLTNTDYSNIVGVFSGTSSLTIAPSDNVETSNAMITEFDGTAATTNVYGIYSSSVFTATPSSWQASRFGKDGNNHDLVLATGMYSDVYYMVAGSSTNLTLNFTGSSFSSGAKLGTAYYNSGYYYYTNRCWGTFSGTK